MILIYITCKNQKEAEKISNKLLKERLIACGNIFPISSLYWWKGKIEKAGEVVLLAKTKEKNFERIKKLVKELHSYEIPLIASFKIDKINKEYLDWFKKEIR